MNEILLPHQMTDPALAGNKAARLAELKSVGFNVPSFLVLPPSYEFDSQKTTASHDELESAVGNLCPPDELLAVRSSSVEEDGQEQSFAGQFDTCLDVAKDQLHSAVAQVQASGSSERIDAYRQSQLLENATSGPAVLVQRMIPADTAGVAFAADPVTGNTDSSVIAAVHGNGEKLVSGAVQGDTWCLDEQGNVCSLDQNSGQPVLTDEEVARVWRLAKDVSEYFGTPQDIEWAFSGNELFLLQSRDITTLQSKPEENAIALWDNSNIVESYGGVTTPLTYSVARGAYEEAYRHMSRALGISAQVIAENKHVYEQMIGMIEGRVYYNLLNWYRLLMLTPGFRFNSGFMEQMMGVTEGLPEDVLPKPQSAQKFAKLRSAYGMSRIGFRLITKLIRHDKKVRKFHREIDTLMLPVDLQSKSLAALVDYYDSLQEQVIRAWDTPLINDLYCMIFHGALRKLTARWLDDDLIDIHNDLVSGESGIISVEPVRRMKKIAQLAAEDQAFVKILCDGSVNFVQACRDNHANVFTEIDSYLVLFGDRCLDELKLESKTLNDDPLPLYRAVGQLARANNFGSSASTRASIGLRIKAESRVATSLQGRPMTRFIFDRILKLTRARVRDRENLRFERTRVYGRVRAIFVELGKRLVAFDVLEDESDVFYLDVREISDFVRAKGVNTDLLELVRMRKRQFERFSADDSPPRRFITNGPAQLSSSMQILPHRSEVSHADSMTGQACSQGIVRGAVRIVKDPRNCKFESGEILVAERTDPGWVTIFPLVAGMIMERGSLLSHSAIVARELGIPAVVGVDDACEWLRDGDFVELDGATGVIKKLNVSEQAA